MIDDPRIAALIRRINKVIRHDRDRTLWLRLFNDFVDEELAATLAFWEWKQRRDAHERRVHDESALRNSWVRPEEADANWRTVGYSDYCEEWTEACDWHGKPMEFTTDDGKRASVYPRIVGAEERSIYWEALGWTPPDLLPERRPVVPVTPLDEDSQAQEPELGGKIFALTCLYDMWVPRDSDSIRPINPWGFSGDGPGRGFLEDKHEDRRGTLFLINMQLHCGQLALWQIEHVGAAMNDVERELRGEGSTSNGASSEGASESQVPSKVCQNAENTSKIDPAKHAIAILLDEPKISPTELAKRVGVSRGTLYCRSKKWNAVRQTLIARDWARVPRGEKSKDGTLEAEDEHREFHPTRDD